MITLTEKAIQQVKKIRADGGDDNQALRIAVAGGGCSGFTYEMYFDNERRDTDQVFSHDGVEVLIDAMSLQYLDGTEVDFVEKSSYEAGFKFNNPNVTSECGCGKSFNTN